MSDSLTEIISKELKKFYFKNFRRRGKSLKTLELIKECYFDQFNFFIDEIDKIFFQSSNMKSEKIIESLLNFKKNEGCNKIIMKALIDELSNFNSAFKLNLVDHKYLFEFDED